MIFSEIIYTPQQVNDILTDLEKVETVKTPTKDSIEYYNCPCAFDIETSSFYNENNEKTAIMYVWQLGLNGLCILGRSWSEFLETIDTITERLELNHKKRLIIYVHNLSYEFQFLCKRFTWDKVFCVDDRKPVYAVTMGGIEFRCSYLLSGYSLEKLGDQLQRYKVKKLVGGLDYNKIRHSCTPLTDTEINYCINDIKVVMAYIQEKIENDGTIALIPLTKTGYVRKYCRDNCFYYNDRSKKQSGGKRWGYSNYIHQMNLSVDEYKQLKRAFSGGFTHANPFYSGKVLENAFSIDFTSSYPTVMVAEQFPCSSSERLENITKEEFEKSLKYYCCVFDIELNGLESRYYHDSYISRSRCWGCVGEVEQNGRIVSAKQLYTTITDVDYSIINAVYCWKSKRISNFRRYKKGYLPTDFIRSILKLYEDKTTLKGVDGKEIEYLNSKEMVNACYGMIVTDIIRDSIGYTTEWTKETPDINKAIEKYNSSKNRFLFYPWGVWVTAYARRNLWSGILEFGDDYIYSDTDSIKGLNYNDHINYIHTYNERITKQIEKALYFHNIPLEMARPKTIKGIEKPLGVWDFEGTYTRFKTLGAKRYMTESDHGINITVSGLNKKVCVPYLLETYGDNVFKAFNDKLYIPSLYTGKNTHTYIDTPRKGVIVDLYGNPYNYEELTSVHLEPCDYSLKLADYYVNFILNIQDEVL